jgi:transcriptional regulator with XRE-family HTH domain
MIDYVPPRTVSAPPEAWQRLAAHVRERRLALNRTAEEVADRGRPGLSVVVVSRIENAKQDTYSLRTLRALCRGLDWSEDSVELILDGDEPVEAERADADRSPPGFDMRAAMQELRDELAEVRAELERLKAQGG